MGGAALLLGPRGPVPADAIVLQAVFPDIDRAIRSRVALLGGEPLATAFAPLLSAQARPRIGVDAADIAPIGAIKSFAGPVLVAGGGKDVFTPPSETRALFEAANTPKWLFIMEGLGHKGMSDTSHHTYRERVMRFLRDAALVPEV